MATGVECVYSHQGECRSLADGADFVIGVLVDCEKTRRPLRTNEPHFPVLADFRGVSCAKRYELLLRRMVTERHYSAACLLLSEPHRAGMEQNYTEPASDLSVAGFIDGLLRRCAPRTDWEQATPR